MNFKEYLSDNSAYVQLALTDRSQRKVTKNQHLFFNQDLSTYGDAILKTAICHHLFGKVNQLTEEKKKYESDEALVYLASKDDLLEHLHFDKERKVKDYEYKSTENSNINSHKYIATAMEAMICAIFLIHDNNIEHIYPIVQEWMKMVDEKED